MVSKVAKNASVGGAIPTLGTIFPFPPPPMTLAAETRTQIKLCVVSLMPV